MKRTREQKRAVLLAQARALIAEFLDCEEQSEQHCISAPAAGRLVPCQTAPGGGRSGVEKRQ
jgi:hypothetical protein